MDTITTTRAAELLPEAPHQVQPLVEAITELDRACTELPEVRMAACRALAALVVDLRRTMGDMDGRTWLYRARLRGLYAQAGVADPAHRNRLQSAVRYHVGAMVRAAGEAPEGWLPETPRERSAQRRQQRS